MEEVRGYWSNFYFISLDNDKYYLLNFPGIEPNVIKENKSCVTKISEIDKNSVEA